MDLAIESFFGSNTKQVIVTGVYEQKWWMDTLAIELNIEREDLVKGYGAPFQQVGITSTAVFVIRTENDRVSHPIADNLATVLNQYLDMEVLRERFRCERMRLELVETCKTFFGADSDSVFSRELGRSGVWQEHRWGVSSFRLYVDNLVGLSKQFLH